MIDFAARKFKTSKRLEWKQVDATTLPFKDESFDVVVCQFGLMFVPDKVTAIRETYRVLKPGGRFVFNVWDAIERNDFAYLAHKTITSFFENDPPIFYEVPFSFHDPKATSSAPFSSWKRIESCDRGNYARQPHRLCLRRRLIPDSQMVVGRSASGRTGP
jgi:SAM-dependent methyltransferase